MFQQYSYPVLFLVCFYVLKFIFIVLKSVNDFTPRGIMRWESNFYVIYLLTFPIQSNALTSDTRSVVWAVTVLVFVWSKLSPFVWASNCSEADNNIDISNEKPLSMLWQSKPIEQVAVIDLVV